MAVTYGGISSVNGKYRYEDSSTGLISESTNPPTSAQLSAAQASNPGGIDNGTIYIPATGSSPNAPLTVPDANNPVDNSLSGTNFSSGTSSSDIVASSVSKSQSTQLDSTPIPDPTSNGIAAAASGAVPSVPGATVSQALPSGAALPTDVGSLQPVVPAPFQPATANFNPQNQPSQGQDQYDRVKLRFKPGHPLASYPAGSVLNPLSTTSGLVWLYKPAVQVSTNVTYETLNLTHAIQEIHAFSSNTAPTISVSGQFVSQNVDEAMYALAAIHFMRTVCKMSFGTQIENTTVSIPLGSPPPVLLLSGYGTLMMNDIPVIVSSFSLDLPADVDYINVPFGPGNGTKIPVSFNLTATLIGQQSPTNMRGFNLSTYSTTGQKSWW